MIHKNQFLSALVENKGRFSETELGESLGLTEDETQHLISQLLDEHKLEFCQYKACQYKPYNNKKS